MVKKLKTSKFLLSDVFKIKLENVIRFASYFGMPYKSTPGCLRLRPSVPPGSWLSVTCYSLPSVTACTGGAKAFSCAVLMTYGLFPHYFFP